MNASRARAFSPATRMASIQRYVQAVRSAGVPVEGLLVRAGIPAWLLDYPSAAVPLRTAFRFGELACEAMGTEHLGLHVGLATTLDDLGSYGRTLQAALTLQDYLRRGTSLYSMLMTGQRLWLSDRGDELRLNIGNVGEPGLSPHQSHLEILAVTVAKCREAIGPDWSPGEIGLAYRTQEALPQIGLFFGSRILRGTGQTYLTIPRGALGLRFPRSGRGRPAKPPAAVGAAPLPNTLAGLVRLQIELLLPTSAARVDLVSESLNLSTRTLQRDLAAQGLTFSQVLAEARMRQAAAWLERTDKPVIEIAFDLGYTDASNFTRAFRRQTGIAPQAFREAAAMERATADARSPGRR